MLEDYSSGITYDLRMGEVMEDMVVETCYSCSSYQCCEKCKPVMCPDCNEKFEEDE